MLVEFGNGIVMEEEMCPYCHDIFYAIKGHDPLKNHFDECPVLTNGEDL